MNEDIIKGKWEQLKGKAKEKWGELTNDDLEIIEGKRDQLAGKLQERYGRTKDEVLGFGGIAGSAAGIAKILFAGFLILSVISLIFGRKK